MKMDAITFCGISLIRCWILQGDEINDGSDLHIDLMCMLYRKNANAGCGCKEHRYTSLVVSKQNNGDSSNETR